MNETETKSSGTALREVVASTPSTGSSGSSPTLGLGEEKQRNLSMSIAEHLLDLMKGVTKEKVNPRTVNAACQCASELHKLMKLNLEIRRSR